MAVIGATELQPVNVVSNYLAGRESRQNQLAQQQEMAMRQQQMAMQQRAAQREEESVEAAAQNALLRRQALATGDPKQIAAAGLVDDASKLASMQRDEAEAVRKAREFNLGNMAREAGAFYNDPSSLNIATLMPWVQSYVDLGIISPEAAQRFSTMPDDPQQLSQAMRRLQAQGLTSYQQTQAENSASQVDATLRGQDITAQTTRRGQDITAQTTRRGQDMVDAATRDRVTGAAGPPSKKEPSVAEMKDAYNAQRLLSSLRSIKEATTKDPGAASPGALESAALSSPFGIFEPAANLVRGDQRQIVAAAQGDAIDTLLYLATGAAYNKEQLEAQRQAYLVNFTDRAEVRKDKRRRLEDLVKAARVRAGRAWTPELEAELQSILTPAGAAAPAGASEGDVFAEADAILKGGQ
jgi:uncharacterized protein YkwD